MSKNMSTESVRVEPDYVESGIYASSTYKNRVSEAGAKYPISIGSHNIRIVCTYTYNNNNILKLMDMEYYCVDCDENIHFHDGHFWKCEDIVRGRVKEYMMGYFLGIECK